MRFGFGAVLGTIVLALAVAAPAMNIVDVQVVLALRVGLRVVDNKPVRLFLEEPIEVVEVLDFVEKYNHLDFGVLLAQLFQNV